MRKFLLLGAVLVLSGCVAATAIETKKLPTASELQAQLAADRSALQTAGCAVEEGAEIAAAVDPNGQRVAQVKTASGAFCSALSGTVANP